MDPFRTFFTTALLATFAAPAVALASAGHTTADVHLRAGPGTGYPVATTVPDQARVNIHGCLSDYDWCDVSWDGDRGWVSAQYLDYLYNGNYVYLPQYVDTVDVPVVTFSLGSYWADYYPHRSWYRQRQHWVSYWREHRNEHHRAGRVHRRPVHAAAAGGPAHPPHRANVVHGPAAGARQARRAINRGHAAHAAHLNHRGAMASGPRHLGHAGRPHPAHAAAPHFGRAAHVGRPGGGRQAFGMAPGGFHPHPHAGGGHVAPHHGGGHPGHGHRHH